MDIIIKKENHDEIVLARIKEYNLPVVIGGRGSVASAVERWLRKNEINDISNCLIEVVNQKVRITTDLTYKEFVFIHGFLGSYQFDESMFSEINGCKAVFYISELYDAEIMTDDYYLGHRNEFQKTYDMLYDSKSKASMEAYINAKINRDARYLQGLVERPQYFGGSFLDRQREGIFVDCGAYSGDTIRDFLRWKGNEYEGIIAFEPDQTNVKRLIEYVNENNLHDIMVINKGAYSIRTELRFNSNEEMSRVTDKGDTVIETETIDNVAENKSVSFIKMDIEGAEYDALLGAEETIRKDHPVLAISAYHKADDLFKLVKLIGEYWEGYKLYFRLHKELAVDAVLYAIP